MSVGGRNILLDERREKKRQYIFFRVLQTRAYTNAHTISRSHSVCTLVSSTWNGKWQTIRGSEAVAYQLTEPAKTKQTRQLLQFTLHQFSMLNTHTHTQINIKAFAIINIILISCNLFLTCKLTLHIYISSSSGDVQGILKRLNPLNKICSHLQGYEEKVEKISELIFYTSLALQGFDNLRPKEEVGRCV